MKFKSDIEVQAGLKDSSGAAGTSGQILSSNGTTVSWVNAGESTASDVQNQVKAGVAINKGQAVYVTSADGTNIIVGLASNTSEATSSKTLGLLDATVAINGMANVVQIGRLEGLNTIGANAGDPVWLGTNGNLIYGLANKPYAPAHLVYIGVVTRVNANNGEIFINVQNGFELDELHNVSARTPSNNNGIFYNTSTSLWEAKSISAAGGVEGSGTTNYVPKFTGASTIGNSAITDDGTVILATNRIIQSTGTGNYLRAGNYTWVGGSGGDYGSVGYNIGYTATTNTYNYVFSDNSSMLQFQTGGFRFLTAPLGTSGSAITFTPSMTLGSNGNLLLNATTDSGYKFDVNGTGRFNGVSASPVLYLTNASGGTTSTFTITENTGLIINSYESTSARSIDLRVGGISALTIASSQAATFSSAVTNTSGMLLNVGATSTNANPNYTTFTNGVYSALNSATPTEGIGMWSDNQGNGMIGSLYDNTASSLNLLVRASSSTNGVVALKLQGSGAATFINSASATVFTAPNINVSANNGMYNAGTNAVGIQTNGAVRLVISSTGTATFSNLAGTGSRMVVADANGLLSTQTIPTGTITGSGTTNKIPKFTGSTSIGDSIISEGSGFISVGGALNVTGDFSAGIIQANSLGTASVPSSGWYKIASINSRGGGIIYLSVVGGSYSPVTYEIKYYKNWTDVGTLQLSQYGSGGYVSDARIRLDSADSIYYVEVYMGSSVSVEVYHEKLLGYNSTGTVIIGTLPAGSASGTTITQLPFRSYGLTTQGITLTPFNDTSAVAFQRNVNGTIYNLGSIVNSGSDILYQGNGSVFINADSDSDSTAADRIVKLGNRGTAYMHLYSTGNLGINTAGTDAGYKLDVNGIGRFSGILRISTGVPALQLFNTTNGDNWATVQAEASTGTGGQLAIYTKRNGNTETVKIRVTENGNTLFYPNLPIVMSGQGAAYYGSNITLASDIGSTQGANRIWSRYDTTGRACMSFETATNSQSYQSDPTGLTYTEYMRITGLGNLGINTDAPTSRLQINKDGWAVNGSVVSRMLQKYVGYAGDYEQHVILLHPIYNGTLIAYNKCSGTIYATRGGTGQGLINDTYKLDTASGYNTFNGTINSTIGYGRLYTCFYNGVKYMALLPDYRTSASEYNFDGYAKSTGEQLKLVTYRMSNTGTIVNSEVYNSLTVYGAGDTYYQGNLRTTSNFVADGTAAIGSATANAPLDVTSASSSSSAVQQWSYNTAPGSYRLQLNTIVTSGLVKYSFDLLNAGASYNNNLVLTNGNVLIGTAADGGYKLDVNGNVRATGFFNSSDIRLKEIVDYDYNISDIKPISYLWKDSRDNKKHVGYSAQEVQKVMPDAVNEDADGMLSVNYIEVLVAKIAELENRIKQLEK